MNKSPLAPLCERVKIENVEEVEELFVCSCCGEFVENVYQDKECKPCIVIKFKRLRRLQNKIIGNRYKFITPDETTMTIPASLPTSRELFDKKKKVALVPWLKFHPVKYLSSTYPRKYV